MKFDKCFSDSNDVSENIKKRVSVRIVVKKEDKYLMITTKRGDFIFPGGGIEDGETCEAAAIRELQEETGHVANSELEYLGRVIASRKDRYDKNYVFEAEMHFFKCNVAENVRELNLSSRECSFEVKPIWLRKAEVLKKNRDYIKSLGRNDVWIQTVEYILENV